MFPIVTKKQLNPTITYMEILAPAVARKAMPGQFIMLRINEDGERIPLTIAGYDREKGTVTIIFQKVGYTTFTLDTLNEGDALLDFVGPLGCASEFEQYVGKHVCVVGGGLGVAIAYPQAKALHELGAKVDFIVGFKNKDLIILEDEFKNACENLFVLTDDGSNGHKGFVTVALEEQLKKVDDYEAVIAIGPLMMMKAVCDMTRDKGIKTIVSMNSLMVDGTGMCGCCRVQVGGETKFACVDGPDFDGHQVDFDLAMRRGRMYIAEEKESMKKHECRMGGAK
ncbi:MAG: sulfide/dihydroorotate dehydrogenase-like FAD/NAD-binding protein [Firmicutes bacterium]|nr:sulfide/dihydroorotate dehydrogenase-like FAD/NAD-binding protein [Bacillota bacterium]MBR2783851.1 sulfide/dihydroorotate dehydrogenase-like FAD/NAD-binding protein [Bacillota bacterium]